MLFLLLNKTDFTRTYGNIYIYIYNGDIIWYNHALPSFSQWPWAFWCRPFQTCPGWKGISIQHLTIALIIFLCHAWECDWWIGEGGEGGDQWITSAQEGQLDEFPSWPTHQTNCPVPTYSGNMARTRRWWRGVPPAQGHARGLKQDAPKALHCTSTGEVQSSPSFLGVGKSCRFFFAPMAVTASAPPVINR